MTGFQRFLRGKAEGATRRELLVEPAVRCGRILIPAA
jgi:hypothetical protein